MSRSVWLGGGIVLVLCAVIGLMVGGADETPGPTKTRAPASAPGASDAGEPSPEFVHANWDTSDTAPEPSQLSAVGLPEEKPPAWTERLKGVEVAHVERR